MRALSIILIGLSIGGAAAQTAPYVFTTLAGKAGSSGSTNEPGVAARFKGPSGIAIDQSYNLYIADTGNSMIRKISFDGTVSTLAGSSGNAGAADGVGIDAQFDHPIGVAVDLSGNVYVADWGNHTIRKITSDGTVTTIAGLAGSSGTNNGTGDLARFNHPSGVAVDSLGNVYVADEWNHAIRRLTPDGANWDVSTVAGWPGRPGGMDGTNSQARFDFPAGLAVDGDGNLYVADSGNNTIRRAVQVSSVWTVTTVAGLPGTSGSADGLQNAAQFNQPLGVAVDHLQNLYVTDFGNHTIRMITPAGVVSTLGGTAGANGSANGLGGPNVPSWATPAAFNWPAGIAVDSKSDVYIAEVGNHTIREGAPAVAPVIVDQPRSVTTIPGADAIFTSTVAGKEPLTFQWKINGQDLPNSGSGGIDLNLGEDNIGTYAISMEATSPYGSVTSSVVLLTVTAPNAFVTLAGSGAIPGYADGLGPLAQFNRPGDVAVDNKGNVYVADAFNDVIRRITADGVTTTIAGRPGVYGYADGVGTNALFQTPYGLTFDTNGNLFVADTFNYVIRKLVTDGTNWTVSTFAGLPGVAGTNNGPGLAGAKFAQPVNITADASNNLYVSDNGKIRIVTPDGNVTTTNVGGAFLRDGSAAGLSADGQGNVFAADPSLNIIWKNTTEFAGGSTIYPGTADGALNIARFNKPNDVALDASNNIYVVDSGNNTIRKIANNAVTTIAGNPPATNSSGDVTGTVIAGFADGVGTNAMFNDPFGVAVDKSGLVYVADTMNHAIRKEWPSFFISGQPDSQSVQVNSDVTFSVIAAAADSDLSYQWFKDGTAIAGANDDSYTIHGVQSINAGNYYVAVTNGANGLASEVATLKVLVPPIITQQPQNQTVNVGDSAQFKVVTTGTTPFSYQWLYNGVPLAGQTKTNLAISSVQTNDIGVYSVAITGPGGTVTSDNALLSFHEPTIVVPPQDQTVAAGSSVTFTVIAGGDGPLSYQWLFNGVAIDGATSDAYTIPDPQLANAGTYTVIVNGASGNPASADFTLTISGNPRTDLFVMTGGSGYAGNTGGAGTVLEISSAGSQGVFTLMPSFPGGGSAGGFYSLGFDPAGNLFAGMSSGGIEKFTPDGLSSSLFVSYPNGPECVAFDSASNVFVGYVGGYVKKYAPDGSSSIYGEAEPYAFSTLGRVRGLAMDGSGRLFASDDYYQSIEQFNPPGNGGPALTFAGGFSSPWGIAFDSKGNLFVADGGSGNIYEFANLNGSLSPFRSVFASGLTGAPGYIYLAIDDEDNVFASAAGNIYKFTPDGTRTTIATGIFGALAFAPPGMPRVLFNATPTNGAAPFAVHFSAPNVDSLGNAITAWTWNFGDGSTGSGQNPTHIYTSGSNFVAHLIATNSDGTAVFGSGPLIAVSAPTINFTATPNSGVAPLSVQCISPSVDSDGHAIIGWHWNFGDGSTADEQNPSHVYDAGYFQPTLVATNDQGVTVVGSGPSIDVSLPTVTFTATPANGTAPLTVQFSTPPVDTGGHAITSWNWDFGDGSTSVEPNPAHTYASEGTYYASLVATNDSGVMVDGSESSIVVFPPLAAPWIRDSSPTDYNLYGLVSANHRLVTVGDNNTILTSTDSTNWLADTVSGSVSAWNAVAYASGNFVAAGDGGAIVTSTDGINWTQRISNTSDNLWGIAFGNGLFAAVGDEGTVVTSPDGISWTVQTNNIAEWLQNVTFNNGQFVAIGGDGEICNSMDGTNWTLQTFSANRELWGITSGNGLFVTVGNNGGIFTSADGTNWTQQDSGATDVTLYNVSCGNGHFVAVGNNGTILLSTDATNWITDTTGIDQPLYGVTYYQNGTFVLAGGEGTILFNQSPQLGTVSLGGNEIQFSLTGLDGSTAVIEATPSLSPPNWQPIRTNTISHGLATFDDVVTNRSLYYRAKVQ